VVVVGSIEVLLLCSSFVVGSHWFVVGIEAVVKTEEVAAGKWDFQTPDIQNKKALSS
jgi:hypothetical protein